MIQTYAHQKELHEARLDIKTLERLFANVITEGTNCYPENRQWRNDRNDRRSVRR